MKLKYYFDWVRLKILRWYIGRQVKGMIKDFYGLLDGLENWEASQETKNWLATLAVMPVAIFLGYFILLHLVEPVKNEKSTK